MTVRAGAGWGAGSSVPEDALGGRNLRGVKRRGDERWGRGHGGDHVGTEPTLTRASLGMGRDSADLSLLLLQGKLAVFHPENERKPWARPRGESPRGPHHLLGWSLMVARPSWRARWWDGG